MEQNLIHAHDVFDLIESFQDGISQQELRELTAERFGTTRFTNCGGMEFDFDEFMLFVLERQKVVEHEGKLMLKRSNICNGEH